MPYTALSSSEIQVKQPLRQELFNKIKENFDYMYGQVSSLGGGFQNLQNGSFEIDSDSDGIPDGWARSYYNGGSGGFETTNPAHGFRAYRFIHPGGSGNGGGSLTSEYIEISALHKCLVGFVLWSTAATMKNIVEVLFYDKAKVQLTNPNDKATIYTSTSNPTSATYFLAPFTPPANARYIKIRLIGGFNDTNVAGTTYFDYVTLHNFRPVLERWVLSEVSINQPSWTDVASTTIYIPGSANLNITAELRGTGSSVNQRFRVGAIYSNEISTTSTSYIANPFVLSNVTGNAITLVMQMWGNVAYGRIGGANSLINIT